MQAYRITIASNDDSPISPQLRAWAGLAPGTSAREELRAGSHAELRRLLHELRHPRLALTYRMENPAGTPHGPAVSPVECTDGWLRHDLADHPFFVYEKRNGKRFEVLERGTGPRGCARERGTATTLHGALALAGTLAPSTVAEILAQVPVHSAADRRHVARLALLAAPGTRLWVLPSYGDHGYRGLGEPATSLGLATSAIEALLGPAGDCWLIRYRTASGIEDQHGEAVLLTLEEAAQRWWVTDGRGNLLSGGLPDHARMEKLAAELGGVAQQGLAAGQAARTAAR